MITMTSQGEVLAQCIFFTLRLNEPVKTKKKHDNDKKEKKNKLSFGNIG